MSLWFQSILRVGLIPAFVFVLAFGMQPQPAGAGTFCSPARATVYHPATLMLNPEKFPPLSIARAPEPGTLAILSVGLAGLCVMRQRRRRP